MKRKALFLDRDGVINEDVGYIGSIDRFTLKEGIVDFLRKAMDHGFLLVVITNQSGVARGMYTAEDHEAVMDYMLRTFRRQGITIDLCLTCFALKDAKVDDYNYQSFFRKPNPGMLLEAAQVLDIDKERSIVIGDKLSDMQAGQAAGVGRCILFTSDAELKAKHADCCSTFEELAAALALP